MAAWVLTGPVLAQAQAQAPAAPSPCGDLHTHYGPYDYRKDRNRLGIVEQYHFTPSVEALVKGESDTLAGDLNYTLHAFPNHHRALVAITRLAERNKNYQSTARAVLSVDCYYDRAIRLAPDDHVVRAIFARYLGVNGRKAEAFAQLEAARQLTPDNGFAQYNIGLVYLELGETEQALAQSHRALALGFTRTELRDSLVRQGKWRDPPPPSAGAAASAPEAPASSRP